MKSSCCPAPNIAGIKHFETWSIGDNFSMSKSARDFIDFLTAHTAALRRKFGTLVYFFASSSTSFLRFEKGLSKTIPAMLGSLSPCNKQVTAPIERPHSPIVLTYLFWRMYSTMTSKSSRSCQPSDIYSPSDKPQPGKSKHTTVILDWHR